LQLLKLAAGDVFESDQFSNSFKALLTNFSNYNSFEELEDKLAQDASDVTRIFKEIIS